MKIGRNELCWCGSGRKYKKCHAGREALQRTNPFEVAAQQRALFARKACLHPLASESSCYGKIVQAHTVRRRADLDPIAVDGHVYAPSADLGLLRKSGGRVQAKLVAVREASTFFGMCQKHDADTFAPLEQQPFTATAEQVFLLAYRCLLRELYGKNALRQTTELWRDAADRGMPTALQIAIQADLSLFQQSTAAALRELKEAKERYDQLLLACGHADLRSTIIDLDRHPDLVASALISPSFDLKGRRIQDLAEVSIPAGKIAFSMIGAGERGAAVLSWEKTDDKVAVPFVQSICTQEPSAIPSALIRIAVELCENIYIAPSWWTALHVDDRDRLEARMSSGVHPELPHTPSSLVDDGARPARFGVGRLYSLLSVAA